MSTPETMVERLAREWAHEHTYAGKDGSYCILQNGEAEDNARWWIEALAAEIESAFPTYSGASVNGSPVTTHSDQITRWLRSHLHDSEL